MKNTRLLGFILAITVSIDQGFKLIAINFLQNKQSTSYMYDIFRLQYSDNSGAFLGIGNNLPEKVRFFIFTIAVLVMLIGLLIYVMKNPKISLIAISIIVGGEVSNVIDRIYNNGAVIDFMNMGIGSLRTGIFNFADIFIMIGVGIFILFSSKFGQKITKAKLS
ncbi:MAG: signal peptidase II [Sulfurimonas sp.]|nr:signal peptidase II [Sulfurimonas sp.]MDD5202551.1 signal peptidase II [Sulfurimonas sp.]